MPAEGGWLRNTLRDPRSRSFGLGVGAALLGYLLWPSIKKSVRPVARNLVKGAILTAQQTGRMLAGAREEIEDLVAEAQHEARGGSLAELDGRAGLATGAVLGAGVALGPGPSSDDRLEPHEVGLPPTAPFPHAGTDGAPEGHRA